MIGLPITLENVKRRALSVVMDFIHTEDMCSADDFPIKIARLYTSLVEDGRKPPNRQTFLHRAEGIRTTFFRLNPSLTKRDLLEHLFDELDSEISPLLDGLISPNGSAEPPVQESLCERIYVDDIDSFSKVRKVESKAVESLVPLNISENKIKRLLAEIIGEKFVPKDWAGEKSDLYSSFVLLEGNRIGTAFLLKGPSVRRLTIDKCGKRGNQVLRLTKEPANLFVVQHIGEIDTDVIELLDSLVSNLSWRRKERLYYSTMDGVDTARILRGYGKL